MLLLEIFARVKQSGGVLYIKTSPGGKRFFIITGNHIFLNNRLVYIIIPAVTVFIRYILVFHGWNGVAATEPACQINVSATF